MPAQKFHEFPDSFKKDLQSILEKRYSIDYFFSEELSTIYNLLYQRATDEDDRNDFNNLISLADYKRKAKIISKKIDLELTDFQEQQKKNFQIPYLYGLVIGSYFIKMAHDKYIASTIQPNKNASNFFNDFLDGNFEKITDKDINDFYQIFSSTLKIGIFSKAFKRKFEQITFSQNDDFCGLLPPTNNKQYRDFAIFIENNIDFIQNNYQSTFLFKRDISLIKQTFIEEASNKFNAIVDKLTEKNTLNKLIMVSPDNEMYKNLVVNIEKRATIENSRLQDNLMLNEFFSAFPSLSPDNIFFDEPDSSITTDTEFENIGAELPLEDKAMLASLFKIKVNTHLSSMSNFPSQMVSNFLKKTLTDISEIQDDFKYFCKQSLNLIDSYIYNNETPPTGMSLITEVYKDISSQQSKKANNTIMLSPLTKKEMKILKAHFS